MATEELAGKVALVTGASGGIGAAIAGRLAAAGAAVALAYARDARRVDELARTLVRRGARAITTGADLVQPDAADLLVGRVERELGPVDVLVANAGTSRRERLEDVSPHDWQQHIAVNLTAPFLLAQRAAPSMRERRCGRILFVSSVAAFTGGIVGPHYAASKAGLHGLTHWLASELAPAGVTVNAIAPALIERTGMIPRVAEDFSRLVPVGRLGVPAEVADLALAVLANGYLTGHVLGLDGGLHPR